MNRTPLLSILVLAFAAALPTAAGAVTCYTVVDRDDAVVYRASEPPFPLAGPDYEAGMRRLRAARQQLFWYEPTTCFEDRGMHAGIGVAAMADAGSIIEARGVIGSPAPGAPRAGGVLATGGIPRPAAPAAPAPAPAPARRY